MGLAVDAVDHQIDPVMRLAGQALGSQPAHHDLIGAGLEDAELSLHAGHGALHRPHDVAPVRPWHAVSARRDRRYASARVAAPAPGQAAADSAADRSAAGDGDAGRAFATVSHRPDADAAARGQGRSIDPARPRAAVPVGSPVRYAAPAIRWPARRPGGACPARYSRVR